jgi:hypothetical protein
MFGHLNHGRNDGLDGPVTITTGAGAEIVEYPAGGAIVAGEVVMLTPVGTVIQGTLALAATCIGVALEAITAQEATDGASVRVCVAGQIVGVSVTNALAVGSPLYQGSVAGRLKDWSGAINFPCLAVLQTSTVGAGIVAGTVYWFRRA